MYWRKGRKKYYSKSSSIGSNQHSLVYRPNDSKESQYNYTRHMIDSISQTHSSFIETPQRSNLIQLIKLKKVKEQSNGEIKNEQYFEGSSPVIAQRVYLMENMTPPNVCDGKIGNFGDSQRKEQIIERNTSNQFISPIIDSTISYNHKYNITNNFLNRNLDSVKINKKRNHNKFKQDTNVISGNDYSNINTFHFRNWNHLKELNKRSHSERPYQIGNIDFESPQTEKEFDFVSSNNGERFRKVALALVSSRGPTCENRKIMRKNRGDIGGVVDFFSETIKNKNSYKILKSKKLYVNYDIEPKKKRKASKIIQNWWRNLKNKNNKLDLNKTKNNEIITIQKWIRGFLLRKNVMQLIEYTLYYQGFCDIIQGILSYKVKEMIFRKIFKKRSLKEILICMIQNEKYIIHRWLNIWKQKLINEKNNRILKRIYFIYENKYLKKEKIKRKIINLWFRRVIQKNNIEKISTKMEIEIIQHVPQKNYSKFIHQQTISKGNIKEESFKLKNQLLQFILNNIFNKINKNNKKIFFEKWRNVFKILNDAKENDIIKNYEKKKLPIAEDMNIYKQEDVTQFHNTNEYNNNDEKKEKKDEINDKIMENQKEGHEEFKVIEEEKQQSVTQNKNVQAEYNDSSNRITTKTKKDKKDKDRISKKQPNQINEFINEPNITKEKIMINDNNKLENENKDLKKMQNKKQYLKGDESSEDEIEESEFEEIKIVTRIIKIEREKIKKEEFKLLPDKDLNKAIKKTNKNLPQILDYIFNKKDKKKLIEGLKWISRIKTLKILTRNIPIYYEDHNLSHYFTLWRENTAFDTMNKTKKIQNFFKKYFTIKKKNTRNNLNDLQKNI